MIVEPSDFFAASIFLPLNFSMALVYEPVQIRPQTFRSSAHCLFLPSLHVRWTSLFFATLQTSSFSSDVLEPVATWTSSHDTFTSDCTLDGVGQLLSLDREEDRMKDGGTISFIRSSD